MSKNEETKPVVYNAKQWSHWIQTNNYHTEYKQTMITLNTNNYVSV